MMENDNQDQSSLTPQEVALIKFIKTFSDDHHISISKLPNIEAARSLEARSMLTVIERNEDGDPHLIQLNTFGMSISKLLQPLSEEEKKLVMAGHPK